MAQTLDSIKGGGGSIKVGTTGTIGSLMTRELESLKNVPAAPVTPRRRSQMASVSVPCGTLSSSKVLQPCQSSSNEASSSSSNSNPMEDATPQKNVASSKKPKSGISKNGHRVPPMISLDGISTPAKETWFLQAFR